MMPQKTSQASPSPRLWRLIGAAIVVITMVATAACGEEEKKAAPQVGQFKLEVSVTDETEQPVAKAPVIFDGKTVGYTDKDGLFQAVLTEKFGTEVSVAVGKMDAYFVPEEAQTTVTLKRAKTLEGGMNTPINLNATVRSARKDYLVWVETECGEYLDDAKCQDLPVMFNGEEVARTDENGKAHFDFEGVPEETAKVSIKTPKYEPKPDDDEDAAYVMKPADPSYDVKLGLESEVLVIKERFADPVAAERAKKKAERRRRYRRRRRRHRSHKKATKKKKKKKKKDDGVIDLW